VAFDDTLSAEVEPAEDTPLVPFLFVAFESTRPLVGSARYVLAQTDEVTIGRGAATEDRERDGAKQRLTLRFPDPRLSSEHARICRHGTQLELTDLDSKNGSVVNGRSLKSAMLHDGDLIQLGGTFFTFRYLHASIAYATDCRSDGSGDLPNGLSTVMPDVGERFDRLAQVSASRLPIMLVGESGTGKELMARAAHALSKRKGAFVAVNCGALPQSLIESELFGYKRGAFSGATEDRPGLLRASNEGTLFLDEIVELSATGQTALLRALQEREVRPIGEVRSLPVDLRVVSATHRDLDEAVEAGRFRQDLFARLAGFRLRLPPLRERREDLGTITATLLRRLAPDRADRLQFLAAAARRLLCDPWTLNVRALEKTLAAALLVCDGTIEPAHLALSNLMTSAGSAPKRQTAAEAERPLSQADVERREQLARLLEAHGGNISAVAREMGKERGQIRRWIRRYKLS
jgi:DNA-binding NtrC family response regulator